MQSRRRVTGDTRLAYYQKAQALYTGDFLPKLSSEPWVVPISAYYHNLYVRTVLESIPLLEERQRYEELIALCRSAIALEPYQESLYQHLMRGLLALGRQAEAAQIYEDMSQLLLSNFGTCPRKKAAAFIGMPCAQAATSLFPLIPYKSSCGKLRDRRVLWCAIMISSG